MEIHQTAIRIVVKSFLSLATLLIVLQWAPSCLAEQAVLNAPSEASTALPESTFEPTAQDDSSPAGAIPASDELTERLEAWSTLTVIGLGIFGLFWVRRHTSEL